MKKVAIALLSILAVSSVKADELSIIGHGFSKHLENHNFNERDYGAALRLERNDFAIQVGAYRNSLYKDTVYSGIDWSPLHYNLGSCFKLDAGLYAGGATGYKYAVTPMGGVQAAVKCENVFVRVRAMPDPFYNSKAVGAIEIGLVLKKF
jgi:hypothetical protein